MASVSVSASGDLASVSLQILASVFKYYNVIYLYMYEIRDMFHHSFRGKGPGILDHEN